RSLGSAVSFDHSRTLIAVRDICVRSRSLIIDWPISDRMNSSKQDVTC
ncbi:unnamed protein product, partial [Staurois parvus]